MKQIVKNSIIAFVLLALFVLIPIIAVVLTVGSIPSFSALTYTLYDQGGGHSLIDSAVDGFLSVMWGLVIIAILIFGASLLFNVTFWRKVVIKSQSFWRIYLGYFILTVFLLSMFTYDALYKIAVPNLWGTMGAFIIVTFTVAVGLSIFFCRLLYKLPLNIEKTNIGSFVIVLYISYAFFKLLTDGFNPFGFWSTALKVEPVNSFANALFLLIIPAIFCFGVAALDRISVGRFRHIVEETK